jgi:GNAT superfamily N-acetyltransferase
MNPSDIAAVVALQRACYPAPFPEDLLWQAEHIERHLIVFPEAQFVCELDGQVVGSSSATIISEDKWRSHSNWSDTVGGLYLDAHDPCGNTLYGLDISVHPKYRGIGCGRSLYERRFDLVRRLGLSRFGTACRIPGLAASLSHGTSSGAGDYVAKVASMEINDRTLTPLLRYGLRVIGVVADYMEDPESRNYAASLEWTP